MKKVIITGASGLLGSNLCKLFSSRYETYGVYNKNKVSFKDIVSLQADLSNKEDLVKISDTKPDYIIHCAAITDLEYCQQNPKEAYSHNVTTSSNVAEVASQLNARLIHISTDAVFDGKKGDYKEEDIPNPVNEYGKTKLEAEKKVLDIYPASSVVRTTIYGWNKADKFSLAEWMLDKFLKNENFFGFNDIYFCPILVNDLSDALMKLIEIDYSGILHIAGSQSMNKFDFACSIAEVFDCDKSLVESVNSDKFKQRTKRAKMGTLNVLKAEEVLGIKLPDVKSGLMKMKQLQDQGYLKGLKGK